MEKMSLGYRFDPTVDEIYRYLRKRVNNIQEPNVKFETLKEFDLYQSCPSDHPGLSKEENTYFFTRRVPIRPLSRHIDRKTKDGKGAWVISRSDEFENVMRCHLGYHLKEEDVKGRGQKTDWIMHEYVLKQPADAKVKVDTTMALCRVYDKNQKNTVAPEKEEFVCTNLCSDRDESSQGHDQVKNTTPEVLLKMEHDGDSSPEDGTGRDKSGVKLMIYESSQENQQNTAAPANEETVFTDLGSEGVENQQNAAAPANEEIVSTDLGSEGAENQQNAAAPANEEIIVTDLGSDGVESSQGHDLPMNTTSTAENDVDLSLRL